MISIIHLLRVLPLTLILGACSLLPDQTLFQLINSSESGIDFSNNLIYDDSLSVLDFEYMYNGAGVAAGDVNNDGLVDLYFTGNMVSGRLYINLGDLKFQDITASAGVETIGWSNGVTMIDINQDGYKDIYVCRGGPRGTDEKLRANLLFINQGDNTFIESAAEFGLADTDYTVQTTFLDFDKDGDLDVYLLSNALVDYNRNTSRPRNLDGKAPSVDKFYVNNGDNTFTDISTNAGILIEGFGLGVQVCDINNDSWPDLYISNDFLTDDLIYINQQNGTFINEASKYLKHQTFNGMGNDLADFNNDGLTDIVVLDMYPADNKRRKLTMMGNNHDEFHTGLSYGYQPQYVRNTLQLNNGNGTFSEIGQLVGIEATDWSWSALFADYDNDGLKDLFITNGYRQDITNLDFMVYGQQVLQMGTPEANRRQRMEALNKLPGIKLPNYSFKNRGNLTFSDETESWGLTEPTYSNGAIYADLDNDGDLDLAINNIDDKAFLYENRIDESAEDLPNYLRIKLKGPKGNKEGIGAKVYLKYQDKIQFHYFTPVRGYLSAVEPLLHFGLGTISQIDQVEVIWPDDKVQVLNNISSNQVISINHEDANDIYVGQVDTKATKSLNFANEETGIDYKHQENEFVDFKLQPLLPHMHSKNGPGIAVGDTNDDGLEDFYVGGAAGFSGELFIQNSNGQFSRKKLKLDSVSEDLGVLLFDADGDTDLDLYIVSGGSSQSPNSSLFKDRLYVNDGSGNFEISNALPDVSESGSCVIAADYDKDGDMDLFVGGRVVPGVYPSSPKSFLLRNDSQNGVVKFTDITPKELSKIGMVTSALWTDYDNDGWQDLMLVGEFMPITFFKNDKGNLVQPTRTPIITPTHGWWNSLVAGDFDNDGDTDYLAGNLGLNSKFRVSSEEPLCIYAKDFDKNGRLDPVMCYYVQGENYLAHSRNDLIEQISAMRTRFRTYADYAEATFDESFLKSEIEDALIVKAEMFESSYIMNNGNGEFTITSLPTEAQVSPIFGMTTSDVDEDGNLDVLLVGNFYPNEVATGRYDASIGLMLKGDGTGQFTSIRATESGLFADKDGRGMARLNMPEGDLFIVANNSDSVMVFKANQKVGELFRPETNDAFALIRYKDNRISKVEFYHGSTYLSQSSRSMILTDNMKSVDVTNFMGENRKIR